MTTRLIRTVFKAIVNCTDAGSCNPTCLKTLNPPRVTLFLVLYEGFYCWHPRPFLNDKVCDNSAVSCVKSNPYKVTLFPQPDDVICLQTLFFWLCHESSREYIDEDLVVAQEGRISTSEIHLGLGLVCLDGELGEEFCHCDLHLNHSKPFTCNMLFLK